MKTLAIRILPLIATGLLSAPADAVALKETPIQSQFATNLASTAGGWADFDSSSANKISNDEAWSRPDSAGRKSIGRAILYSALLPGLGEYYAGNKVKAKFFFAAEALSWIGFISFKTYSKWKEDDVVRFASERAGADLSDKDDWFLDMVGFYDDIDQYNSIGRVWDPERPYLDGSPENHWRWQSYKDRESYRELKNGSREASRRADFVIGAAIVNRIISVIDAARDAKKSQRRLGGAFSGERKVRFRFALDPLDSHCRVSVTMYAPF